jgi:hypothetical protein
MKQPQIFKFFIYKILWLYSNSTVVEHSTRNPKIAGLNHAIGTGSDQISKKLTNKALSSCK